MGLIECPNCKKEIPDGAQFCSNCGANFAAQPQQPVSYPVQQPAKQKKPITKKWWFWVIIVFVGLIIISSLGDNEDVPTQSDPSLNSSTEQIETSNIETSPVESTSIETTINCNRALDDLKNNKN